MKSILASDSARCSCRDFHDHSVHVESLHVQVSGKSERRPEIWRMVFHGLLFAWIFLILVSDAVSKDFLGYTDLFMSAFIAMGIEAAGCWVYLYWRRLKSKKEGQ